MSTPILWIAFPAGLAFVALFFRRWKRFVAVFFSVLALLLAVGSWLIPIGEQIVIGSWSFFLSDTFVLAGRQFVLGVSDRTILGIVYMILAFFFIGAVPAGVSSLFVPFGLAMGATLIASLAVEPYLYAALFIQVAVLIGVPLLSPPGIAVDRSVLRYLAFLSFGLPFILFSGWMLSGIDVELSNPGDVLPALVFLGFGFAFLLAVFPLNTWIPMLMQRVDPYAATFIITLLPVVVISFLQRFIDNFSWLLEFEIIQFMGLLVLVTAALWAAFQRDLGRLLGFAAIIEIGRSLLIVSRFGETGIYESILLPRLLAFGVWALSLALIRKQTGDLSFRSTQGMARRAPVLAIGVVAPIFSVAGFPLLAGFPMQLLLLRHLAQVALPVAIWGLMGSIGLLIGGLRSLAVLLMGPEVNPPTIIVNRPALLLIGGGLTCLVLLGLSPLWVADLFSL